jgi:hypothetical protein
MVSNKSPLFYMSCLLFLILFTKSFAQKTDIAEADSSYQPLWILILPGTISDSLEQSLEDEITRMVADIARQSGRLEVFDRFDVRELLMKYQLDEFRCLPDSIVLILADSTECDEALIIDLLGFSQIGVPPDEEEEDHNILETVIDGLFSSDSGDYSDNIYTLLFVQFRNMDMATGEEIDRFSVRVSHTGGTKPDSEEKALDKLHDVVLNEIRMIYHLGSEVIAVDGVDLDLDLSSTQIITGNTLLEVSEPEEVIMASDEEVIYPGKPAGLAYIHSVGDTVIRSLVVRQWSAIKPGFYAYEFNKKIHGIQLFFLPIFPGDYMYIGGQFHYSPLGIWDIGGSIRYIYVTDSHNEKDHGFGFGIFCSGRLLTETALTVHAKMNFDLDLPFKKDDDGHTVTTSVFSSTLGISGCFMLSKKSDFEINLAYRLSTKSYNWTYTEDEANHYAFWDDGPPVIDLSGFYFTVGYKFLLF